MNNIRYATLSSSTISMSSRWLRYGYMADVAWSGDESQVVAVTRPSADPESALQYGSTFWVEPSNYQSAARRVLDVPLEVTGGLAWVGPHVYFQSWNVPGDATSGRALYRLDVSDTSIDLDRTGGKVGGYAAAKGAPLPAPDHNSKSPCEKVAGGETNCVLGFKVVRGPRLYQNDDILVHVRDGNEETLVLLLAGRTIYTTDRGILDFAATNTRRVGHGDGAVDETTLAIVQGDVNHPSQVFSVVVSSGELVQLSDHGATFAGQSFGTASMIECPSRDGADGAETIDALFLTPTTGRKRRPGSENYPSIRVDDPPPTVVLLNDGPYSRATNSFDRREDQPDLVDILAPLLLRVGVAVLQPNYRGGSGRGARFASLGSTRVGGRGRHDVSDIVALTDAAVKQGLADPAGLFAVGWSHGGYLAYMTALVRSSTRGRGRGWGFRGAVCGAAVSDWYSLALTSSAGYQYAALSGHIPWRKAYNSRENAAPSPLRELADVVRGGRRLPPRLLILHGEADTLVPVSQVEGVRRSLAGLYSNSIVTYPGQGHFFEKRASVRDMLERIVEFVCEPLRLHVDDSIFVEKPKDWLNPVNWFPTEPSSDSIESRYKKQIDADGC